MKYTAANGIATESILSKHDWRSRIEQHRDTLLPWVERRRDKGGRGIRDIVYDFLFDYYAFRPAQLLRWSPGVGVILADAHSQIFDGAHELQQHPLGLWVDPTTFPAHRVPYLNWAIRYLEQTGGRAPHLSCFGLHEWAMVYKCHAPRHTQTPLRLSPAKIEAMCEELPLKCTHFDAFRFFTPSAVPLNNKALSRAETEINDQPGCIHVTMDLYRFAHKIAPFISAEIIADTFILATQARTIDMRASPYDLTSYGFEPICIETSAGRAAYVALQHDLYERGIPLRIRLIEAYKELRQRIGHVSHSEPLT